MTNELLAEISLLKEKIARLEKERDAAVEDLKLSTLRGISVCRLCKNIKLCDDVNFSCKWEWRGVQDDCGRRCD